MFYQVLLSPQVKRSRLLLANLVCQSCLTRCRRTWHLPAKIDILLTLAKNSWKTVRHHHPPQRNHHRHHHHQGKCKYKSRRQGWHTQTQSQAPLQNCRPGPANTNWEPGPVNTGDQGRQTQTGPQGGKPKLGPTPINTNWGPGPANTNWETQTPLANFKNLQIWILSAFDLVWIDLNFVFTGDLSELSTSFRFWTFQDAASTLIYELGHEHLDSA